MTKTYTRLYRDPRKGKLLGVCAGVADYFGVNPWAVRLAAIIGLLLFAPPTLIAYGIAAMLLPVKPVDIYDTPAEESFWRGVRVEPSRTTRDLRHRFRELERRLRALEAYITSREFDLSREINNLDK